MSDAHLVSVDGAICPAEEARIPLLDDGVLRGDGVFEMLRLYGGRPFALAEHLRRLGRSAEAIQLDFDLGSLEGEVKALLAEHGEHDAALRIVITRGGRRIAICEPLPDWRQGISLAPVRWAPDEILAGVKTTSYAANMQATRLAQAAGADEAILVSPIGIVLEAPTSTVFWASADGGLQTPALGVGILESITRARIMEALDVEEGEYELAELAGASEAFLASSTREVQAVAAVDGRSLADLDGARTREAREALRRAIQAELPVAG